MSILYYVLGVLTNLQSEGQGIVSYVYDLQSLDSRY